jgi:hypothetical protein
MKPLTNYLNTLTNRLNSLATGISDGFVVFLAAVVTVLFVAAITLGVKG